MNSIFASSNTPAYTPFSDYRVMRAGMDTPFLSVREDHRVSMKDGEGDVPYDILEIMIEKITTTLLTTPEDISPYARFYREDDTPVMEVVFVRLDYLPTDPNKPEEKKIHRIFYDNLAPQRFPLNHEETRNYMH